MKKYSILIHDLKDKHFLSFIVHMINLLKKWCMAFIIVNIADIKLLQVMMFLTLTFT